MEADADYLVALKPLFDAAVTERNWNELLMPVTRSA